MAIKTHLASGGKHVGTSGFVNYIGGASTARVHAALEAVFAEHPGAVVLDGSDDWYVNDCRRPGTFPNIFGIKPLARFHTGCSGISKSGIVVSRGDFERIELEFPTQTFTQLRGPDVTGRVLRECVRVYESTE